jgi:hypothetical protein
VNPRPDDDIYAKVIEIAQEQAQASSAQAELHRQNVTKMDTVTTLLSAQTTTMVGIATALQHINEARERDVKEVRTQAEASVTEIKREIAEKSRHFWIGVAFICVATGSETVLKLLGVLK